jgi:hypothetical protein
MERRRKVVPRRAKKETDNNTFLMGLVRIVKPETQVIVLAMCLKNGVRARARRARSAGACQRHSTLVAPKGALLHSGSPRVRRSARCVEQHHITSLLHVSSVSVSISWGRLLGRLRLVKPISLSQPLQTLHVAAALDAKASSPPSLCDDSSFRHAMGKMAIDSAASQSTTQACRQHES